MKKLLLALIVVALVGWSGEAFAAKKPPKPSLDFNQFRMVNTSKVASFGKGNPNALKTFAWTQSIFAYVKLDSKLLTSTQVTFRWIAPDTTSGFTYLSSFPKSKKGWSPFTSNGLVRQSGLWNVEASFVNQAGNTITKTRQFVIGSNPNPPALVGPAGLQPISGVVVNPEPMALILYGLGGLPIAAHFLRRRKTAA